MSEPTRASELVKLHEAALAYAKAVGGLRETIGMGPAQLHCMAWEERARKALKEAFAHAEEIGLVDHA